MREPTQRRRHTKNFSANRRIKSPSTRLCPLCGGEGAQEFRRRTAKGEKTEKRLGKKRNMKEWKGEIK